MFLKKSLCVMICAAFLALSFTACGGGEKTVTIGSKNFTENIILGEIFAQLIEAKTDLKVTRKLNLNGTFVAFEALKKGDLDIYPDYTGTGFMSHLKLDLKKENGEQYNSDEIYDIVKKEFNEQFGITWLDPLGINNTYAIAVKQEFADKNNISKASDLAALSPDLVFGAEHEFYDRPDGYPGMIETYGYNFKGTEKMETALKYEAIAQDKMQVTDAFATDGQLIKYKLKILEDDKGFFPPYYAAALVNNKALEKNPELESVLNSLAGKISDEEMQQLNYQVEVESKEIEDVAKAFLEAEGLI